MGVQEDSIMSQEGKLFDLKFKAIVIGNILEYWDFSVFGTLIDVLAELFFPEVNELMSFLQGAAVFGAAFFMRPIGGIIFGIIGDLYSRELALTLSVALMLITSLMLCFLPTYDELGIYATILLILIRLMQGIAVGGEFVGSMVFIHEGAQSFHGLWGGATKASAVFGNTLGLGVAAILRYALSDAQLRSYGWRIPFGIGAVIGLFGVASRNRLMAYMEEEKKATAQLRVVETGTDRVGIRREMLSPVPIASATLLAPSAPRASTSNDGTWVTISSMESITEEDDCVKEEGNSKVDQADTSPCYFVGSEYLLELAVSFGFITFWCLAYYTVFVWNLYFLTTEELIGDSVISKRDAWLIIFISNCLVPCILPVSGYLGDLVQTWHTHRIANSVNERTVAQELSNRVWGHVMIMKGAALLMLLTCVGAYQLMLCKGAVHWRLVVGQITLTFCTAFYGGNMAAVLAELYPVQVRYTGMGISYNVCNALVSGTATIAQSYLVMADGLQSSTPWLTNTGGKYLWCSPFQALFADKRLHAALYLQCVSVLALFSLSFGIARCSHRDFLRKLKSSAGDREAATHTSTSSGGRVIPHLTQIYVQRG